MNLQGDIQPGQEVLVTYSPDWRPRTYRLAKIDKVQKLHVVLDDGTKWSRRGNHPVGGLKGRGGELHDPADPAAQEARARNEAEQAQITARSDASSLFDRLYRKGPGAVDWRAIVAFLEQQETTES